MKKLIIFTISFLAITYGFSKQLQNTSPHINHWDVYSHGRDSTPSSPKVNRDKKKKEEKLIKSPHDSIPTPQQATEVTPANSKTVVFVLTLDQVKLLEYVISESGASYKSTSELIDILRNQQYHAPKDSVVTHK